MKRPAIILLVAIVSGALAWIGEPLTHDNSDLFIAIVTLFAVFGGFLVAVMSIAGDPLVLKKGGWAGLELGRDSAMNSMHRARLLFYAYLIAATLILVVLAIHKSCNSVLVVVLPFVNFFALWFSAMGVLFSFALPSMLIGIQEAKIDGEIERRRGQNGSGPEDGGDASA